MPGMPRQDKDDPVRSHILQVLCLSPCSSVEGGEHLELMDKVL